jgi:hypothetical protein
LDGAVIAGVGFTVIVYVEAVPVQPLRVGVIIIVAVIAAPVGLAAVNAGTLPVPLPVRPIAVLELVHAKVAPAGVLAKLLAGTASPGQYVWFVSAVTAGLVFTTTVVVPARLVHPPTVTVTL